MDSDAALRALNDARSVQATLAERARCPPSWHAAFGLLMGSMIAGQAAPVPLSLGVTVACIGAAVLMMRAARRRMGFFVNGYRRGRTRRVALALLAFVEAVLAVSLWLKLSRHIGWAPIAGGVLVAPMAVLASYAWQAAYRADLSGAGPASAQ